MVASPAHHDDVTADAYLEIMESDSPRCRRTVAGPMAWGLCGVCDPDSPYDIPEDYAADHLHIMKRLCVRRATNCRFTYFDGGKFDQRWSGWPV